MNIDLIPAGKVLKPVGINGVIQVHFNESLNNPEVLRFLFIRCDFGPVPFAIESIQLIDDFTARVKLVDIDTPESARTLQGNECLIEAKFKNQVFKTDPEREKWLSLESYDVVDVNNGLLGSISEVYELPGHAVARLIYREKELLIPLQKPIVQQIDTATKTVHVRLPDGFLEAYL